MEEDMGEQHGVRARNHGHKVRYNREVNSELPSESPTPQLVDPYIFGTICGLTSAFVYTCANAFLRAVDHCDPFWVSAVKALPTAVAMTPVILLMLGRGQRVWPGFKLAAAIAAGGLLGQIGGNVCFQWSLDKIGMALAASLCLGGMIVAAATFGRVFLGEPVTGRAAIALGLLLAAIVVLSLGAQQAGESVSRSQTSPLWLGLGVAAACGSGVFYATLNVILRYCFLAAAADHPLHRFGNGHRQPPLISWLRIGASGMAATEPSDLTLMLAAGLCNTVAFVALTKSLQLTSVVYVNALNATQVSLAAIAGVVIFREALSPWLALGTGLTIVGLLLMAQAHKALLTPPPVEGPAPASSIALPGWQVVKLPHVGSFYLVCCAIPATAAGFGDEVSLLPRVAMPV
jgi:drug/metabolite transporter (DMT)-like permease